MGIVEKRNRKAQRSHPYNLPKVSNDLKVLRDILNQELSGTVYAHMVDSRRNVANSNIRLSYAFFGHDIILESADGFRIGVNKAFLAEKSHYFQVVFNGPFAPVKRIHRFNSIPYEHLYNTLAYLDLVTTTNNINEAETPPLNLSSALNILDTASYLQMDELLEVLANVILRSVATATIITVFRRTSLSYPRLSKEIWQLMTWKFDLLVASGHFVDLQEDELIELLEEPALNLDMRQESEVITEWLTTNDLNDEPVKLRERWETAKTSEYGFLGRPRTPTSILLAHSGWSSTGPTNIVDCFDKHRCAWVNLDLLSNANQQRAYHSLVATPKYLYSIGGFNGVDYYDSVQKMNLETLEWEDAKSMGEKRCYLSTALLDEDHFLAIGGFDSEVRFRTAEIYSIEKNVWEPIAPMGFARSDAHSVVVNGQAYVIGGFDGVNCHPTMEVYIPERNEWFMVVAPMHYTRSGVKAVQIGGVIMVAGGFDGRRRLRKCEFYDPRVGAWHKLASMQTTRSNFGIEVFNTEVVVAGGYEGRTIIDQVESYDWRCNTWLPMPTMSTPRSALNLLTFDGLELCKRFLSMEELQHFSL